MPRISCLARIDREPVGLFLAVLAASGVPAEAIVSRINVAELGKLAPAVLVCDLDDVESDPLEMLRQLRFVLPGCIIVVYTMTMKRAWAVECHLAGASGIISKDSSEAQLARGMRSALRNGCFTDPRFAAA